MRFRCLRPEDWRPWFAWYPVRVGSSCIWLETVERRQVKVWGYDEWDIESTDKVWWYVWEYNAGSLSA